MPMNAIFVLEPNGQSWLSLLGTLAPPGGHFPGTPHSILHLLKNFTHFFSLSYFYAYFTMELKPQIKPTLAGKYYFNLYLI